MWGKRTRNSLPTKNVGIETQVPVLRYVLFLRGLSRYAMLLTFREILKVGIKKIYDGTLMLNIFLYPPAQTTFRSPGM